MTIHLPLEFTTAIRMVKYCGFDISNNKESIRTVLISVYGQIEQIQLNDPIGMNRVVCESCTSRPASILSIGFDIKKLYPEEKIHDHIQVVLCKSCAAVYKALVNAAYGREDGSIDIERDISQVDKHEEHQGCPCGCHGGDDDGHKPIDDQPSP